MIQYDWLQNTKVLTGMDSGLICVFLALLLDNLTHEGYAPILPDMFLSARPKPCLCDFLEL